MRFTLNDLPVFERPRERLHIFGAESLSMQELLEIIMSKGCAAGSVHKISQNLIFHYHNLQNLNQASVQDLCKINGIGSAKATQIKAAFELGKRLYAENSKPKQDSILTSIDAYKMSLYYLAHKNKEHLLLFCLDVHCRPITKPEILSVGVLDCSLVHPREIFSSAIKNNSAKIILAHNHPSGVSTPSKQDIEVTRQIYEAGRIMGIELLDHIVLGKNEYASIRQQNPETFETALANKLLASATN
jgi:DNA repair protein RadC